MSFEEDELELYLDSDKITELFENFKKKDYNGSGYISIKDVREVIQTAGIEIADKDIRKAIGDLENDSKYNINYSDLKNLVQRNIRDFDTEEEIIEAFRVFDKGNSGYIADSELKEIILSLQEKITESEIDEMIKDGNPDGEGYINYIDFVKRILYK